MMTHLPRILIYQPTWSNPPMQINPPSKIRLLYLHCILIIIRLYLLLITLALYHLFHRSCKPPLDHPLHVVEVAVQMVSRYLIPRRKILVISQSRGGQSYDLIVEAVPSLVVHENRCDLVGVSLDRVVIVDVHYLTFTPDHFGIPDVQQIAYLQRMDRRCPSPQVLEGCSMTLFVYLLGLLLSLGVYQQQQFVEGLINVEIIISDIRSAVRAINRK